MNGLPYYKAYPRDFIEGTIGMPFDVKCAYRVVLDLIYLQGGALPDDARYISGNLGCSIRKWKSIREHLIEAGKIEVSGEFLTNKRADKEIETLSKYRENQAENARKSRKNKDLEKPSQSQRALYPEPEPEEKKDTNVSCPKRAKRATTPEGFEDFWNTYPHRNGVKRGKQKAEQKFRTAVKSGMTPDALIEAANRYRQDRQVIDGYAKDPATWLNGNCWEDEIEHPDNVHAMRRKPEPGDRRKHPVTGQHQYYINHSEGWMNEVC